jgi:hypothetical protein
MEPLNQIAQAFKTDFAHWGLELSLELLKARQAGFIQAEGWLIQFTFGIDRRGEYLDYYACHRMTIDSHVRLYESGRRQNLATLSDFLIQSPDPVEAKRRETAYYRRNGRVARQLAAKGFDKFTINMALEAGLVGREADASTEDT